VGFGGGRFVNHVAGRRNPLKKKKKIKAEDERLGALKGPTNSRNQTLAQERNQKIEKIRK